MLEKLKIAWINKHKIIEGVWATWFPSKYVEKIASKRIAICKQNLCGYYDPSGKHPKCFVSGTGCCTACGCRSVYKTHSLSSYCSLKDKGISPLWDAEMTEEQEEKFRNKTGIKND